MAALVPRSRMLQPGLFVKRAGRTAACQPIQVTGCRQRFGLRQLWLRSPSLFVLRVVSIQHAFIGLAMCAPMASQPWSRRGLRRHLRRRMAACRTKAVIASAYAANLASRALRSRRADRRPVARRHGTCQSTQGRDRSWYAALQRENPRRCVGPHGTTRTAATDEGRCWAPSGVRAPRRSRRLVLWLRMRQRSWYSWVQLQCVHRGSHVSRMVAAMALTDIARRYRMNCRMWSSGKPISL